MSLPSSGPLTLFLRNLLPLLPIHPLRQPRLRRPARNRSFANDQRPRAVNPSKPHDSKQQPRRRHDRSWCVDFPSITLSTPSYRLIRIPCSNTHTSSLARHPLIRNLDLLPHIPPNHPLHPHPPLFRPRARLRHLRRHRPLPRSPHSAVHTHRPILRAQVTPAKPIRERLCSQET